MKTMKISAILILIFTFLIACSEPKVSIPAGTYYGVLPCADCSGISYELSLREDFTFVEKRFYQGKSKEVMVDSGTFEVRPEKIVALQNRPTEEGMQQFAIKGDSLHLLDIKGQPIESTFKERYLLTKTQPANFSLEPPKVEPFIGFRASGNEPFWLLEIDFNGKMRLKTMNEPGQDLVVPVSQPIKPQDTDAVNYKGTAENGELSVTIFREKCIDSMSGKSFPYKVQISALRAGSDEPTTFEGCGQYQGDYRLHDIWVLTSWNGEAIDPGIKAPNLELQLTQGRIAGFGGCNRLMGPLSVEGQLLKFGPIASTEMACPQLALETKFLTTINNQSFRFQLLEPGLRLEREGEVLEFKKVD